MIKLYSYQIVRTINQSVVRIYYIKQYLETTTRSDTVNEHNNRLIDQLI